MTAYDYYRTAVRTADDCIHEVQGGDIIRPWTNTPACALCRRRHPVHWKALGVDAAPRPKNVVPIHGTRSLF